MIGHFLKMWFYENDYGSIELYSHYLKKENNFT